MVISEQPAWICDLFNETSLRPSDSFSQFPYTNKPCSHFEYPIKRWIIYFYLKKFKPKSGIHQKYNCFIIFLLINCCRCFFFLIFHPLMLFYNENILLLCLPIFIISRAKTLSFSAAIYIKLVINIFIGIFIHDITRQNVASCAYASQYLY